MLPLQRLLVLVCVSAWLTGCASERTVVTPTQVMLRIQSTDEALTEQITRLRVSASLSDGSGYRAPVTTVVDARAARWPIDIPVFPRKPGDERKRFDVLVEALKGELVLAQARALTSFIANKHAELTIELFSCPDQEPGFVCSPASCRGEACLICDRNGACVPVGAQEPSPVIEGDNDAGSQEVLPVGAGERDAALSNPVAEGGAAAAEGGVAASDGAAAPSVDAGVEDGSVMHGIEVDAGPCVTNCKTACAGDGDCANGTKCDKTSGECVECLQNTDCPQDKAFCKAQACVACLVDADCKTTGYRCEQNVCVPSCRTAADCRSLPGSVCSATTNSCQCEAAAPSCAPDGQIRATDSCGGFGAVEKDCCGRGCVGGACNPPIAHARTACHNGDVYWIDSCGTATDMVRSCCNEGCAAGTCKPVRAQASKTCVAGDSYWVNSCGATGALAKSCCGAGCSNGECAPVNPQASRRCHQGHVYWFDSCGQPGGIAENCGTRDCLNGSCRRACPSGMVPVPGMAVCIDKYESSFWTSSSCTGTRYDRPPEGFPQYVISSGTGNTYTDETGYVHQMLTPTTNLYACSVANVRPTTNITWFQAKRACENSNKRLCKDAEWAAACPQRYPYGDTYIPGACHHTFGGSVAATGSSPQCQGGVPGLYDMVGNVSEWLDATITDRVVYHASGIYVDQNTWCSHRQGSTHRENTVYNPGNGMYLPSEEGARCCVAQ